MATTYIDADELARLQRMTGEAHKASGEELISEADFDDAAYLARVKDADGEVPHTSAGAENSDYTNTVDLYKAASIIWTQKANIFAERFTFTADGSTFQRNQAYHNAVTQANRYADMAMGSTPQQPTERA